MIMRVLDVGSFPGGEPESALPVSGGREDHEGIVNSLQRVRFYFDRTATEATDYQLVFNGYAAGQPYGAAVAEVRRKRAVYIYSRIMLASIPFAGVPHVQRLLYRR
jgi:hypothetical protein